jgi:hypothetical protein
MVQTFGCVEQSFATAIELPAKAGCYNNDKVSGAAGLSCCPEAALLPWEGFVLKFD